jgi:GTPase SAR1 family protein
MKHHSLIINLFGGPGIGKSSIASGLTHEFKKRHISCDCPYEFPKSLAWDNNNEAIKDQFYVIANQHRGIAKSYGKVKYIIVDSPLLLSLVYKDFYVDKNTYPSCLYGKEFDDLLLSMFNFYDNLNVVLKRGDGDFNEKERYQNLEESKLLDTLIKNVLDVNDIPYITVDVSENPIQEILKIILK